MLEGLQIAAETIGAVHAFLGVKRSFAPADRGARARRRAEMTERALLGSIPISIVTGPEEYLFGEETGLLEVVEGNDPLPRILPPYSMGLFATTPPVGWSAGADGHRGRRDHRQQPDARDQRRDAGERPADPRPRRRLVPLGRHRGVARAP